MTCGMKKNVDTVYICVGGCHCLRTLLLVSRFFFFCFFSLLLPRKESGGNNLPVTGVVVILENFLVWY